MVWPTKSDDFFPYASDNHTFWNGYFVSRPTLKRFERMGNNFLQVCKQLSIEAQRHKMPSVLKTNLIDLQEAVGIMQHHDAITGTEKQHVAEDYAYLLNKGVDHCLENTHEVLNHLTIRKKSNTKSPMQDLRFHFDFDNCHNLNISSCEVSENATNFMVTIYNPLAQLVQRHIRIPVPSANYEVKDHAGDKLATQVIPIAQEVIAMSNRMSRATVEIVFQAKDLPPLGYRSYYISKTDAGDQQPDRPTTTATPVIIGNDKLKLQFDENGLLSQITTDDGVQRKLAQSFHYYNGALGNNEVPENRSSGAYIFRPNGTINSLSHADIHVINGDIADEVHQVSHSPGIR